MYNETSTIRQQRIQEAHRLMQEAIEYLASAIGDEYDQSNLASLERIEEQLVELTDDLVTYANDVCPEDLVDKFLYGTL